MVSHEPAPASGIGRQGIGDRLASLLADPVADHAAARDQFGRLADLLGRAPPPHAPLPAAALERLDALEAMLAPAERAAILGSARERLRHPALILRFARQAAEVAEAALAAGRNGPVARAPIDRHGDRAARVQPIGRLVRRNRGRDHDGSPAAAGGAAGPRHAATAPGARSTASHTGPIGFASDARGRIVRAADGMGPMLAELPLGTVDPLAAARCDPATARAFRERRPVSGGRIVIDGSPLVAGAWRIDAAPRFAPGGSRFLGYGGVLRRPGDDTEGDGGADRVRQLLHELRTPMGAIQGFAELIEQQLFGPAPPAYRARATAIAVESAAVLAAFADIERLVRLERGQTEDPPGQCDLAPLIEHLLARLRGDGRADGAAFVLDAGGPAPAALAAEPAERTVWGILSALAAEARPGELLRLQLAAGASRVGVVVDLPEALAALAGEALFAHQPASPSEPPALLGGGFALRLARAEAEAVGGTLDRARSSLRLRLPRADQRDGGGAPPFG